MTFSPFSEESNALVGTPGEVLSPLLVSTNTGNNRNGTNSSTIPILHHDSNGNGICKDNLPCSTGKISRSFQSDNDPIVSREWRAPRILDQRPGATPTTLTVSPVSDHPVPISNAEYDPFEIRLPTHDRLHSDPIFDLHRFTVLHRTL